MTYFCTKFICIYFARHNGVKYFVCGEATLEAWRFSLNPNLFAHPAKKIFSQSLAAGCMAHCKWRLLRIQYKCWVPIYVFPAMKLLFPKQNYKVLSPSSYPHISVRDLYISRICLPILQQENIWTDHETIKIAHRHMNLEIVTEAAHFPEREYINGILLQCTLFCK
jgi:hypothetical protein